MIPRKYSESNWILVANAFTAGFQLLNIVYVQKGIDMKIIVFLLTSVVFVVPFLLTGIIQIRDYNKLIINGKRITTNIIGDHVKYMSYQGSVSIYIESTYSENGNTYLFERKVGCHSSKLERALEYFREHPTIDVLTDTAYKKSYFIIEQDLYDIGVTDDRCPAKFNYTIGVVNILLLVVNILQEIM